MKYKSQFKDEFNNGVTIISKDSKNELNGFGNIPD